MSKRKAPVIPDNAGARRTKSNTIPLQRGRVKSRFLSKHAHLISKQADSTPATGIIVTCDTGADVRALGQARTLLDEFLRDEFPDAAAVWPEHVDASKLEIDAAFTGVQPEPTVEKPHGPDRMFQAYDSGAPGILFFRFRNSITPSDWLDRLCERIASADEPWVARQCRATSFCQRWIPAQTCCPANLVDVAAAVRSRAVPLLEKHAAPVKIAIVAQVASNARFSRRQLIDAAAASIPDSSHFSVDLKNPDLVVSIVVFKSVAAISVLSGYYERRRYNLSLLLSHRLEQLRAV